MLKNYTTPKIHMTSLKKKKKLSDIPRAVFYSFTKHKIYYENDIYKSHGFCKGKNYDS
jgi:hypothetical protein